MQNFAIIVPAAYLLLLAVFGSGGRNHLNLAAVAFCSDGTTLAAGWLVPERADTISGFAMVAWALWLTRCNLAPEPTGRL